MHKKIFLSWINCFPCLLVVILALGFSGGNPFLLPQAIAAAVSPLTFSEQGGTLDAGSITYSEAPYTWTVTLPSNFIKAETIHYDKSNPSNMRKYMGWNGHLKVNGQTLWQFKSWSSQTGGLIYDGSLGQEVYESTGVGQWIDATNFFHSGSNTVVFDHFNEGAGIGLKIKVTTGGAVLKSDGSSCTSASECQGGYCLHYTCRSSSVYCGDGYCDSAESCSSCSSDCGVCKKSNGSSCTSASECQGGYCVHYTCRSSSVFCGDGYCDSGETCSNCSSDCGACVQPKPSTITFYENGGTEDGGAIKYSEAPYTWTVILPANFGKVETAHYDVNNPDALRKYMGWNGYLEVNSQKVWEFQTWSSQTGGLIYDGSLGREVYESTGVNQWIDATQFFKSGPNVVKFYHYNEGDGIGLKIRVTPGVAKKSDGSSCTSASECQGGYCVHYICRSSSVFCGDGYCDSGETCSNCSTDCGKCKKPDGSSCSLASECSGGYCLHYICRSSSVFCGDGYCDSGETCSNCSSDCGACEVPKKEDGASCSVASECRGGYCLHYVCRSVNVYCGDKYCDSGETCSNCSSDCGICPEEKPKPPKETPQPPVLKGDGAACVNAQECRGGYCIKQICRSTPNWCGDNHCDKDENCLTCSGDCPCQGQQCCSPSSKNANSKGCVVPNQITKPEFICCSGEEHSGNCCQTVDCASGKICSDYFCLSQAQCGNNICEYWQGENCNSCSKDCSCFSGEVCLSDSAKADLYGCLRANKLTAAERSKCKYVWCDYQRLGGNCCYDSDCGAGEECSNYACQAASSCGDGACQREEGENCLTCPSDCGCSYSSCCYPSSSIADTKGCVSQREKMSSSFICCDGSRHFGNCCSNEQCQQGEECWDSWCRPKPKCGDGICHYDNGENCQTCAGDCSCYGNDCCSPASENTDRAGCLSSREKAGNNVCCFGKVQTGDCCSNSDCSSDKECLANVCSVSQAQCLNNVCEYEKGENCSCSDCACSANECCEPSSGNKNNKGCVASGKQSLPGQMCCQGRIRYGNCCSNADCRGGEKCVGYHCTKFLDLFYKHYYRNEVAYGGGFVKHSDLYRGISDFYRETATQINVPIMSLGKFVQALDAVSDTARSVVSLDVIGIASNVSRFFDEMETWEISEPEKVQNNILYFYSAATLAYEFADRYGDIQPAVQALSSKLPFNNVLSQISKQHSALQSKIATQADVNQLFYFEVADFIMDATLLAQVNDYLRYDVLDYQQKIQLSITAGELAALYERAESYNLGEDEAWMLMSLEKKFWTGALAKSTNSINFEEVRKQWWSTSIYNALGANSAVSIQAETETKNSAHTWLVDLENRRKVLFNVYLGMAEGNSLTKVISSSFGSIINALRPQEILK